MKTNKVKIEKSKQARCRYCHLSIRNLGERHCVVDGWEDDKIKIVTEEECGGCDKFDSKYIEYPLTINGIENKEIDTNGIEYKCGTMCEIRPCGEEYNGKSYVGFYIGDLPISIISSFNRTTGVLENRTLNNPAIFVPELNKIIYGCESWWREIDSIEDFKGISEEDINDVWYVKLLKQINKDLVQERKDKK